MGFLGNAAPGTTLLLDAALLLCGRGRGSSFLVSRSAILTWLDLGSDLGDHVWRDDGLSGCFAGVY